MDLESALRGTLLRAYILEKALYGNDEWEIQCGNTIHRAVKELKEDGVLFTTLFKTPISEDNLVLLCNKIPVLSKEVSVRNIAPNLELHINWKIGLSLSLVS